jgi:hypothetical protein
MIHGTEMHLSLLAREFACMSERFGVLEALLGVAVPSFDVLFAGRD